MKEANDRKRVKYSELAKDSERNAWRARFEPLDVECKGLVGLSLCRA